MRKLILITYFLIAVLLRATSHGGEIQVRAFWAGEPFGVRYDEPLTTAINVDVIVQFRNGGDGEETLLFRKGAQDLLPTLEHGKLDGGMIWYNVSYGTVLRGGKRIPSIVELSPVRLGPGEMTEFRFSITINPTSRYRLTGLDFTTKLIQISPSGFQVGQVSSKRWYKDRI